KTLMWQLDELYKKYGVFTETLTNIQYPGAEGFATMQRIMKSLRENPPKEIAGIPIVNTIDREKFEGTEKGNVLIFELSDDHHNRLTIRPSGTEPKIKIYTQLRAVVGTTLQETKQSELARASMLSEAFRKLVQ
ncbi:MAG TPA: phospho-sugar mutase, partial [Candidatus Andersenbacteria bacterium]|nr:phospho-sugar mutase [Candidatus Andersenbacteria bacterium]